jgi:hypothetical protein
VQNVVVKLKVGNAPFVAQRQTNMIPITSMKALIVIACQSAKYALRQTIFVPANNKCALKIWGSEHENVTSISGSSKAF